MYMQFQFFTNHVIVFIGRCTSFLTYKLRTCKESVGYETSSKGFEQKVATLRLKTPFNIQKSQTNIVNYDVNKQA